MKMPLVPRDSYLRTIKAALGKPVIKVLTGMRRSGKSSLLTMLRDDLIRDGVPPEKIVVINKESLEFDSIRDYKDLYEYLKRQGPSLHCIMIDEIQDIEGWEKAAASILADEMGDLIITGSNAALLSSELATLLTGRYLEIQVFPLGFREFLDFRQLGVKVAGGVVADRAHEFSLYLHFGGLPGIHAFPLEEESVAAYLSSILSSILLKDVVKRYQVRDVALLEKITMYLMENCGNITTAKNIADYFKSQRIKASVDSVMNYMTFLGNAFLFSKVRRYDIKGRRVLELYEKYYSGDFGLRFGLLGYRDRDIAGILENAVYLELVRRGFRVFIGAIEGKEVDFIAEKSGHKEYYQVSFRLSDAAVLDREFGSFEKIQDNYPKFLLTLDEFQVGERNGIQLLNLIDWLLDDGEKKV